MAAPLLLVDIDGVLNPWQAAECPDGFEEHVIWPEDPAPLRLSAAHASWLHELASAFESVLASAWGFKANQILCSLMDFPELHHVPFPPIPGHPDHVLTDLSGIGRGHLNILPAAPLGTTNQMSPPRAAVPLDDCTRSVKHLHRVGRRFASQTKLAAWPTSPSAESTMPPRCIRPANQARRHVRRWCTCDIGRLRPSAFEENIAVLP